jgi:hypothetical protein
VDEKRVQKSADQLAVGDWLAPDQITDGAAEVLHALTYPAEGGTHVHVVVREQGKAAPHVDVLSGNGLVDLATEAELAELREQAERTQKIADIRALADVLERERQIPMPSLDGLHAWIAEDGGPEQALSELREIAALMGLEIRQGSKMSEAKIAIGSSVSLQLVAWHPDGRPDEPQPVEADDLGDDFDRSQTADADETSVPVDSRRREPHAGAVLSGIAADGHRVTQTGAPSQLVDELDAQIPALVELVHMDYATGESLCGLSATTPHEASQKLGEVTCRDCRAEAGC